MQRPSKVVILGHTGFIGKALYEFLLREGVSKVEGYSSSAIDLRQPNAPDLLAQRLDQETILIFTSCITRDRADTLETFTANLAMSTHVAQFLRNHTLKKCVYLSSVSVYEGVAGDSPINESTPVSPTSFYAMAKYTAECLLQRVTIIHETPLLILRPPAVYGPGDTHNLYGIQSVIEKKVVRLFGDAKVLREYLYIGDLVRIVHHLTYGDFTGIYNLVSGQSHSFLEILETLRSIPFDFKISHVPRNGSSVHQRFDAKKLLRAIPQGFRFTELREGIQETCRAFLAQSNAQPTSSLHG